MPSPMIAPAAAADHTGHTTRWWVSDAQTEQVEKNAASGIPPQTLGTHGGGMLR